eukprot:403355606
MNNQTQVRGLDKQAQLEKGIQNYNEISEETIGVDEYDPNNSVRNQGVQGDQLKFDSDPGTLDFKVFDPNTTQTRALLNISESRFDIYLQRTYQSNQCQFFYIFLMLFSVMLVILTIWKGFTIDENPFFILAEVILNILMLLDFIFRVKLVGLRKYLVHGSLWNIFDALVVSTCIVLFLFIFLSKASNIILIEELSEEVLLIVWSVFQIFRMIFIAKKQNLAQQNARTLIDFSNVLESEAAVDGFQEANINHHHKISNDIGGGSNFQYGQYQNEYYQDGNGKGSDDVIAFDINTNQMQNRLKGRKISGPKKQNSFNQHRGVDSMGRKNKGFQSFKVGGDIEMQDIGGNDYNQNNTNGHKSDNYDASHHQNVGLDQDNLNNDNDDTMDQYSERKYQI